MKQYEQGSRFVKAVVDEAGMEVFNKVWTSPETLPTKDEIASPQAWLDRVGGSGGRRSERQRRSRWLSGVTPDGPPPRGRPGPPRRAPLPVRAGLAPGDLVLAACSGGADSLALAAALAFEAPRLGLRGGGVTVDHGLQDGSAEQAGRVAKALDGHGPRSRCDSVTATVARPGAPATPAPRRRRGRPGTRPCDRAASAAGAAAILLGHTMDDQAETVLLGLARGSGARSLAGMPERNGRFLRPLLAVSRAQTRAACAALRTSSPGTTRRTPTPATPGPGSATGCSRPSRRSSGPAWPRRSPAVPGCCAPMPISSTHSPRAEAERIARARLWPLASARRAGRAAAGDQVTGAQERRHRRGLPAGRADRAPRRRARRPGDRLARPALDRPAGRRPRPAPVWQAAQFGSGDDRRRARVDATDMGADLEDVLITPERLQQRIAELAAQIDADYADRELLLVGVLKGAVMVMADLARAMRLPGPDGLDGGLLLRLRHEVLRRGAHPQGPRLPTSPTVTCWSSRTSSTPA